MCYAFLAEALKQKESRYGGIKFAPVQTPLSALCTRSQLYDRRQGTFRTTTYPAAHGTCTDGTVRIGQITPYASAASPSDSAEPASSASNSSSRPSVIVSRTADTE